MAKKAAKKTAVRTAKRPQKRSVPVSDHQIPQSRFWWGTSTTFTELAFRNGQSHPAIQVILGADYVADIELHRDIARCSSWIDVPAKDRKEAKSVEQGHWNYATHALLESAYDAAASGDAILAMRFAFLAGRAVAMGDTTDARLDKATRETNLSASHHEKRLESQAKQQAARAELMRRMSERPNRSKNAHIAAMSKEETWGKRTKLIQWCKGIEYPKNGSQSPS